MIADFPTLKDAVQNYCARSDTKFGNMVETFVAFAEDRIFNGAGKRGDQLFSSPLRVKEMEKTTTRATDATGLAYLPDRCLLVRSVEVDGQKYTLKYMSPDKFAAWGTLPVTGSPQYYTVEGVSLKVIPAGVTNLRILYYEQPAALRVDSPTHDVLVAYPMIYLSATLFEAFTWMREVESAVAHLAKAKASIDGANRTAADMRILSGAMSSGFEPIG